MNDDIINAKKLLNNNRRGHHTIPSNNLYPHQWSWDSAWIIYGYCITKEYEKAENEMYALAIIGLLTTVISAFYYLKIIKTIYFDDNVITFDVTKNKFAQLSILISCITLLTFFLYPSALNNVAESLFIY